MSILQNIDTANIGFTSKNTGKIVEQNRRLIEQNDEIIELLGKQLMAVDFLARMKRADIEARV